MPKSKAASVATATAKKTPSAPQRAVGGVDSAAAAATATSTATATTSTSTTSTSTTKSFTSATATAAATPTAATRLRSHSVTLDMLRDKLPSSLLAPSNTKALLHLFGCIMMVAASAVVVGISPTFMLPLSWLLAGVAICSLFAVAHAASNHTLFKTRFLNHLVGQLATLPLLVPFESFSVRDTLGSVEPLAKSSLWFLSSTWHTAKSNVAAPLRALQSKRVFANLALLYVFCLVALPLMTLKLGWWGLFKFYVAPLVAYHFWLSVFIKQRFSQVVAESDLSTFYFQTCPRWIEVMSGDLNIALLRWADSLPKYNLKSVLAALEARAELKLVEQRWFISEINWPTVIYLVATPLLALYGIVTVPFHAKTYATAFAWYYLSGIGITAGYHRLFSHRSYDAHWSVKLVLGLLGTASFEGSILDWCRDHRAHHRYTDTELDPYNAKNGFFYSHIGWMLIEPGKKARAQVDDLAAVPMIQFQHRHYFAIAAVVAYGLPTLFCGLLWDQWLGGFLIAGVLSRVVMQHCTFFINSAAHYFGTLTYSDQRTPRDNPFLSLFTFGEGYHAFHHEFPYDYRNGVRWYDYDPGKWVIAVLNALGLCKKVLRFPDSVIQKGLLQMQEKKLRFAAEQLHWGLKPDTLPLMTWEQVHDEGLVVIDGYAHDVSSFQAKHPGGERLLANWKGGDATKAFTSEVYRHSFAAFNVLDTLRVGKVVGERRMAPAGGAGSSSSSSGSAGAIDRPRNLGVALQLAPKPAPASGLVDGW